jgi:hypothetical protein
LATDFAIAPSWWRAGLAERHDSCHTPFRLYVWIRR